MKKEEIPFLKQLVNTLEEAELKLEEFYKKKDSENFNRAKKLILQIHKKVLEVVQ